jgi:spore maturation protein SpmA
MAYLAFLLVDGAFIISGSRKIFKSSFKVFPVSQNHPSISYMTLNFAANFLGLDSAATPFGLKLESLQK